MTSLLLHDHPGTERPTDVAGVVTWFGAMQAQDLGSVMWSLGVRLPALTTADVQAALERREALRTWPMRGTVHLVPPRDARWMLEVMGVRTLAGGAPGDPRADREGRRPGGRGACRGARRRRPPHPGPVPRGARRGRHRLLRTARLPPSLVRQPAGRHLYRTERGHRADLCTARRVGARAVPAGP